MRPLTFTFPSGPRPLFLARPPPEHFSALLSSLYNLKLMEHITAGLKIALQQSVFFSFLPSKFPSPTPPGGKWITATRLVSSFISWQLLCSPLRCHGWRSEAVGQWGRASSGWLAGGRAVVVPGWEPVTNAPGCKDRGRCLAVRLES